MSDSLAIRLKSADDNKKNILTQPTTVSSHPGQKAAIEEIPADYYPAIPKK